MDNKFKGEVELTFIRGGIARESKKPYLQVSNGRKEFFLNIPKEFKVDEGTFSGYEENDPIRLDVTVLVGTDSVRLNGILD